MSNRSVLNADSVESLSFYYDVLPFPVWLVSEEADFLWVNRSGKERNPPDARILRRYVSDAATMRRFIYMNECFSLSLLPGIGWLLCSCFDKTSDPLTSLPLRDELQRQLELCFADGNSEDYQLFFADVIGMKKQNTLYGYSAGDRYLLQAVACMRDCLPGVQLCRYGGDEFAALLSFKQLKYVQGKIKEQRLFRFVFFQPPQCLEGFSLKSCIDTAHKMLHKQA